MSASVTVDTASLDQGLARLAQEILDRTTASDAAAAEAVAREARGRVARRTGETAAAIRVVKARTEGRGFLVVVDRGTRQRLPFWLEYGTRYMSKRPFLYVSAVLEAPRHERTTAQALETAISVTGFAP